MAEKALRMKKEFLGQVFLLGSREPNPPKEINGVSGRYVQLQAECSREEQPAFLFISQLKRIKDYDYQKKRCVFHLKKLILFFVKNE
ncbi:hypothetical protein ACLZX5_05395 [Enterococcus faecium]